METLGKPLGPALLSAHMLCSGDLKVAGRERILPTAEPNRFDSPSAVFVRPSVSTFIHLFKAKSMFHVKHSKAL
jgi:hypothetical protein